GNGLHGERQGDRGGAVDRPGPLDVSEAAAEERDVVDGERRRSASRRPLGASAPNRREQQRHCQRKKGSLSQCSGLSGETPPMRRVESGGGYARAQSE